jgi:hypothetical protein
MSDPRRVRAGQAVEEPDWFPHPITQPKPRRKYWPYVIAVAAVALFAFTVWRNHV